MPSHPLQHPRPQARRPDPARPREGDGHPVRLGPSVGRAALVPARAPQRRHRGGRRVPRVRRLAHGRAHHDLPALLLPELVRPSLSSSPCAPLLLTTTTTKLTRLRTCSIEVAVDARSACPACNHVLSREHIIAPPAERSVSPFGGSRASSVGGTSSSRHGSAAPVERTAKAAALVTLLKSSPPGVKSLVFSQVRSTLSPTRSSSQRRAVAHAVPSLAVDLAPRPHRGGPACRRHLDLPVRPSPFLLSLSLSCSGPDVLSPPGSFDGSMRQDKRADVIRSFTTPNKTATAGSGNDKQNPMVMLLSLKVRPLSLSRACAARADGLVARAGRRSWAQLDRREPGLPHGSVRRSFLCLPRRRS